MEPEPEPLVMYGAASEASSLDWAWADEQLTAAGGYWIEVGGQSRPHPRPVWGVWDDRRLHLSIGSPAIKAAARPGRRMTSHLGSVTEVVIVDGRVAGETGDPRLIQLYNDKYDWEYSVDEYGPLTTVDPTKVMAWRSSGWAGREGFQQTGRWRLDVP